MIKSSLVTALMGFAAGAGFNVVPNMPVPKPKRKTKLTQHDVDRIDAAQAKRDRKNAKRVPQ